MLQMWFGVVSPGFVRARVRSRFDSNSIESLEYSCSHIPFFIFTLEFGDVTSDYFETPSW